MKKGLCKAVLLSVLISIVISCSKGYDPDSKARHTKKRKGIDEWYSAYFKEKKKQRIKGMGYIPPGEAVRGRDYLKTDEGSQVFFKDQHPRHKIFLKGYYIDRFEVTRAQVWGFDQRHSISEREAELPAVNISWKQAKLYCDALGKRLPTEAEWEKAARGIRGRLYPWGDNYKNGLANVGRIFSGRLLPVGSLDSDVSEFGIYDMAGNAAEWTSSWYMPYENNNFKVADFGESYKVVKGFSINRDAENMLLPLYTLSSYRYPASQDVRLENLGFRCALSSESPTLNKTENMVEVAGDSFAHENSFYIDKYEITNNDYSLYSPFKNFINTKGEFPVVNISWFMASRYCRWLGKRLPTEKEWDIAASGLLGKPDLLERIFIKGKLIASVGSSREDKTVTGIYDMIGNAKEWIFTWGIQPERTVEMFIPLGGKKVVKGIENKHNNKLLKKGDIPMLSYRSMVDPYHTSSNIGFRCASY